MALVASNVNIGWVCRRYTASLPPRGGLSSALTCTTVTKCGSMRGTATFTWRGAVSTTSCMSVGTRGRLEIVYVHSLNGMQFSTRYRDNDNSAGSWFKLLYQV